MAFSSFRDTRTLFFDLGAYDEYTKTKANISFQCKNNILCAIPWKQLTTYAQKYKNIKLITEIQNKCNFTINKEAQGVPLSCHSIAHHTSIIMRIVRLPCCTCICHYIASCSCRTLTWYTRLTYEVLLIKLAKGCWLLFADRIDRMELQKWWL